MTIRFGVLAVIALAFGHQASAQVVTQWNFPSGFDLANPLPSTGSGAASRIGGTTATSAGGLTNGGSTEATAGSVAWNTATYPAASAGNGTAGVQFLVSTAGLTDLIFRFDHRHSNTSSRYLRVEYTTNGSTWVPSTAFEAYAGGDVFYNARTVDLSGVAAANNNANFGVRVVAIFDPANNSSYTQTQGSSYGTTGTWRFDAVTLSAGHVWTGAGGNTSLGTAANYSGAAAPGATGTVMLGSAGGANTTVATAAGGTTLDQLVFQAGAPAYTVSGGDILTLNAGVVNGATNAQLVTAPVTFGQSNTIQNTGAVKFTGAVNFTNFLSLVGTGGTTLNGAVVGTSSALTTGNPQSETIRVAPGATLAGIGTIGSAANLNDVAVFGGAIRGGDPTGSAAERVGVLTVNGNVTINNSPASTNGTLRVEASRNTGTIQTGNSNADSSVVSASGTLNIAPGIGNKFTIDVVNGTNSLVEGETYTIQLAGAGAIQLNSAGVAANTTISAANYVLTSSSFGFSNVSLVTNVSGTGLYLTFTTTPVPEPGALLALAAGAVGVGGYVRRRIRRGTVAGA